MLTRTKLAEAALDMTTPHEGYVRTRDGLQLFYRDYPGARGRLPVVCLPGLNRNSKDFVSLAGRIAPGRRVIAPDQRGRGLSDRDPVWMRYIPPVYVDDMWMLLDALGLQRVVIIGTSLGGIMAMLMASTCPQRLAGVVLNDIGPELDVRGFVRIRDNCGRLPPVGTWDQAVAQMRFLNQEVLPDLTPEQWLEHTRNVYREDARGVPVFEADPKIGDAVRLMPRETGSMMWAAYAALRAIPTLLLRGEHSDLLSAETVERMRDAKPDLVAVTVPNRGHAPLLNEPESVAAIDAFLARLP